MTINQILAEQMKEFEKEFSNGGKGKQWDGYWEDVDMFISTVKIEDVKAFIHSYTRKLIESLAEEIKDNNPFVHECGKENGCDICLKEEGYRTVEDKMKEIITNLK